MTHPRLTTALVAALVSSLLAIAAPSVAGADDDKPGFEIGGFAGAHLFSDDNEIGVDDFEDADSPRNSVTFGIRLGYWLHSLVSVEGEVSVSPTETRESATPVTVIGWRANALVHFTDTRLQPFALLGLGFLTSSPRDQEDIRTDTDLLGHVGVGARYRVGDNWGVRADARLLFPPSSADDFITTDWELLVGLYKTFSGEKPAPTTAPGDSDGDGITDDKDKCPGEPEDPDGFEDEDGCPDTDNDNDGFPDTSDACPNEAETQNGIDDTDGCPEEDADGDGIVGSADQCPDEPEDMDGVEDTDGCPDPEPDAAEPDRDGDGIPDARDQCPDEPETKNGYDDTDGCPDTVPTQVQQFTGTIEGIEFELGSAVIAASSRPLLDKAAGVLARFKSVKLEIQGHTDTTGSRDFNVRLSQQRADAVKAYLVTKGIDASRLTAKGYGPDKPVADNGTFEGRKKNRRVEFVLVSR
jgi:OOP family OmpA-OmpF porin